MIADGPRRRRNGELLERSSETLIFGDGRWIYILFALEDLVHILSQYQAGAYPSGQSAHLPKCNCTEIENKDVYRLG